MAVIKENSDGVTGQFNAKDKLEAGLGLDMVPAGPIASHGDQQRQPPAPDTPILFTQLQCQSPVSVFISFVSQILFRGADNQRMRFGTGSLEPYYAFYVRTGSCSF